MVTNQADDSGDTSRTDTGDGTSASNVDWSLLNWIVIAVFGALTAVGLALSIGLLEWVVAIPDDTATNPVTIPVYVYLYAALGTLGYIFTRLMHKLDRYAEWSRWENLVEMAMRIPAACILAAGVYLFLGNFGSVEGVSGARFAAGVSFLVGLYVNVALKALGSLADRILGRAPPGSE
jgi:H+/Cl- antiporter ClcA